MSKNLLTPEEALALLAKKFARNRGAWLYAPGGVRPPADLNAEIPVRGEGDGEAALDLAEDASVEGSSAEDAGAWPMRIVLGNPSQKEALDHTQALRSWVQGWNQAQGTFTRGAVQWETRQWSRLGSQSLPRRLTFWNAQEVCALLGTSADFETARQRFQALTTRWPVLGRHPLLGTQYEVLATYAQEDFERLVRVLEWLLAHPASGHYVRQLPVLGLDTKWLERRKKLVVDWLTVLQERDTVESRDFFEVCGLRSTPRTVRMRVLCPELRAQLGGLCHVESTPAELAAMSIRPRAVLIVENLETGLALPDFPGTIAFMGLGHGIDQLGGIAWIGGTADKPCHQLYWGDLDTHGFAILARARGLFPAMQSVLMDEETLVYAVSAGLAGTEPLANRAHEFLHLTPEEQTVYTGLKVNRWGTALRVEQERLPWARALGVLTQWLGSPGS